MKQAFFRFYAELNDFLPPERRAAAFPCSFLVSAPVRDLIESLGAPHTEVDLILANGRPVDFSYVVEEGDRISVFPVFESLDITAVTRVRPRPLREPRFVLDVHLGRLAAYLRMLGFDTLYRNDYADEELALVSSGQERILLSRDRGLLKRGIVTRGYCVRETRPARQLEEVVARFDLLGAAAPFVRCLACNGLLEPASKESVGESVPAGVRERQREFQRCARCGRVFWRGTHWETMKKLAADVLGRQE